MPITRDELECRFGAEELAQLLDDGAAPEEALANAAQDADALIDGYVGGVYQLPMAEPVPAMITALRADVTRYRLWDDKAPAEVRKRYEDAIALLKDIGKGTVRLPAAPNVVPQAAYSGTIATTCRQRSFTDHTLGGFVGRGSLNWPPRTD